MSGVKMALKILVWGEGGVHKLLLVSPIGPGLANWEETPCLAGVRKFSIWRMLEEGEVVTRLLLDREIWSGLTFTRFSTRGLGL